MSIPHPSFFSHHDKPTLSSLCSGFTAPSCSFSPCSSWPWFFCCSFPSQKLDEKKKYKRVMCLCTDGPVRDRMCCMASLEAERTRWFVGHLVFPSLWRIVKPTQELLVKTLHYPWWLYWLLGGGVVLWGLLHSTGRGSARPGVHQEGKGESFYQGLWSSGGHGPPPAQR